MKTLRRGPLLAFLALAFIDHAAFADDDHADDKAKKPTYDIGGRLFVRAASTRTGGAGDYAFDTSLLSARVKGKYAKKYLRGEVEVELANKVRLKNAFVKLIVDAELGLAIRAGSFKQPFSAIQRTSLWTLPLADRGLIDSILVDRLQVAGRAVGAAVELEPPLLGQPRFELGVFQGTDDAGTPLSASVADQLGQDVVARAEVTPTAGVTLGGSGSLRAGRLLVLPATVRHAVAGELDATLELAAGPGRLRAWAEGTLGTSWLVVAGDPSHDQATFYEARAIVAWRSTRKGGWHRFVEPYALAGLLDPDTSIRSDLARELSGGVAIGGGDHWRVQLEVEDWRADRNAPLGLVVLGEQPSDQFRGMVQLGGHL